MYIYMHTYTRACTQACTCMCVYIYIYIYIHICIYICIHIYIHIDVFARVCVCVCVWTYIHIHIYVHFLYIFLTCCGHPVLASSPLLPNQQPILLQHHPVPGTKNRHWKREHVRMCKLLLLFRQIMLRTEKASMIIGLYWKRIPFLRVWKESYSCVSYFVGIRLFSDTQEWDSFQMQSDDHTVCLTLLEQDSLAIQKSLILVCLVCLTLLSPATVPNVHFSFALFFVWRCGSGKERGWKMHVIDRQR